MDKHVVMQHNLVDRLLDGIGDAFLFKKMSHFHIPNLTSIQVAMHQDADNLAIYNHQQSLVPHVTNYMIHANRTERDHILKVVKVQIEGSYCWKTASENVNISTSYQQFLYFGQRLHRRLPAKH
jgi:hypothetical protein